MNFAIPGLDPNAQMGLDDEDDLLEELLALEDDDNEAAPSTSSSRATAGKAGPGKGVVDPQPVNKKPKQECGAGTNSSLNVSVRANIHIPDFASVEISDDIDVDDEDLLAELDGLDDEGKIPARLETASPIPPQIDEKSDQNNSPPELPKPSVPSRSSSVVNPLPTISGGDASEEMSSPPALTGKRLATAAQSDEQSPPAEKSISTKAELLLTQRRELYMRNAKAAKEADDRAKAGEYLEVVKMFQQALEMLRSGETLTEEDLEQIPPSPPPYRKAQPTPTSLLEELQSRMEKFEEVAKEANESGNGVVARYNTRMVQRFKEAIALLQKGKKEELAVCIDSLPTPPGFEKLTPEQYQLATKPQRSPQPSISIQQPSSSPTPSAEPVRKPSSSTHGYQPQSQLELVTQRQAELKNAALAAKSRGDMAKAKEFLSKAHQMDRMVEAAKCGLPVDVPNIPMIPAASVRSGSSGRSTALAVNPLHSKVRKELQKQIDICEKSRNYFQRLGHASHTLFYDRLLAVTLKDMAELQALVASAEPPKFKLVELNLPVAERNEEVPENIVEMRVLSIESLQLPAGWQPHHLAIFVIYNFPYPREQHQQGRTQTAKGSVDMHFPDVIKLNVQRRSAQLARICKRIPLKLEVYQKGGFMRSDKLWYHSSVHLEDLLTKATSTHRVSLMEGRKATRGVITIELKQNRPLDEAPTVRPAMGPPNEKSHLVPSNTTLMHAPYGSSEALQRVADEQAANDHSQHTHNLPPSTSSHVPLVEVALEEGVPPVNSTTHHNCSRRRGMLEPEHVAHKPRESDQLASSVPANIGDDGTLAPNDDALEYMVTIPEVGDEERFSWRKLWAFTGPGFLMSIAYLDPGNIESDLQSGAIARYKLLWVLLSAHILGFFLQRLSARLGVVSGRHMAEMAYEYYPRVPRLLLWVMIEIAIIGSDMQEVIGTAIAFSLLSNGYIPLFAGVLITMADTFTFLTLDRYGFRKLEVLFAALIATMAFSFGYEFFIVKPQGLAIIEGMFVPWCAGCGRKEFLQGVSVVGAVIMPHNLYLHSALVKSRRIDRTKKNAVTEANLYYFIESGIALLLSFVINLFVVSVFAHGLYGKTNADVYRSCAARPGIPGASEAFPNNTEEVESDIYKSGIFLGCEFGLAALYVWGMGIMAAGQSSTMTGTYAGQFVMEGFLRIQWPRWRRVMVTRAIAIVPTLLVALKARGVDNLTGMNDLLNCVQMIQLPFALIPIITFTSHRKIMFEYKSGLTFQIFALLVSALIIAINLYFATDFILTSLGASWYVWLLMTPLCLFYMTLVLYLIVTCMQAMGVISGEIYSAIPFLHRSDDSLTVKALWLAQANGQPSVASGQAGNLLSDAHRNGRTSDTGAHNLGYTNSMIQVDGSTGNDESAGPR